MKVFSQSIPKNKFLQWHQILCQTQGRYINNPIVIGDVVKVNYEPGNYLEQEKMWQTINTVILEKKPSLLKRLKQKIKGHLLAIK